MDSRAGSRIIFGKGLISLRCGGSAFWTKLGHAVAIILCGRKSTLFGLGNSICQSHPSSRQLELIQYT